MKRFLLILTFFICLAYSHNNTGNNSGADASYDLKRFQESAEEFTEQFASDVFDIELILGNAYEFLENSFPVHPPQVPSLAQNHTSNTSLFMPVYINKNEFYQKAGKLYVTISDYSLNLPLIFYHPPRASSLHSI